MAIAIASGVSTPGANTKTADLITGQYQYLGKGVVTLYAKGSAAGINATLAVNGTPLIDDLPVIFLGSTGGLSVRDNVVVQQTVAGGRVQFFLRNITATAGTTCDYYITFDPLK